MTGDRNAPKDKRSFSSGQEELNRILIQEFYQDSVERYGTDSEQARALLQLLKSVDSGSERNE